MTAEYMFVVGTIVGSPDNWTTDYYCTNVRFNDRQAAIDAGLTTLEHDDFLIVTVDGDRLVAVGWQHEDRDDADELAEVARALNLKPPMDALRDLIRELRAAGWRHTTHWRVAPPGYPDGYPDGEDCRAHEWVRGQELIQTWTDSSDGSPSHVLYERVAGSGDLADMVTVGHNWIEQRGFGALRRLADAVGVTRS